MAEELGPFERDVSSWKRAVRMADSKPQTYAQAVRGIIDLIPQGLARADAVDILDDILIANDLEHLPELRNVIIVELERLDRAIVPEVHIGGNGKANGKGNGLGGTYKPEIEVAFPFPIKGSAIPRRPWIVPGLLLRRQVTLLVAPPGIGKSLFTLQIAMACGAGLPEWGGWRLRTRARVLVINSEEDPDEMRRRLYAATNVMGITAADLAANFAFAAQPDDIVIAKADNRTKTVTRTPMVERIVQTLSANTFDILVVDPFAETFVGDENDNSELKWC